MQSMLAQGESPLTVSIWQCNNTSAYYPGADEHNAMHTLFVTSLATLRNQPSRRAPARWVLVFDFDSRHLAGTSV